MGVPFVTIGVVTPPLITDRETTYGRPATPPGASAQPALVDELFGSEDERSAEACVSIPSMAVTACAVSARRHNRPSTTVSVRRRSLAVTRVLCAVELIKFPFLVLPNILKCSIAHFQYYGQC